MIKMIFRGPFLFAVISAFLNSCLSLLQLPADVASLAENVRASENYEDIYYFSNTYSLDGVRTYSVELSCDNTKFIRIDADLKNDYCGRLNVEIKNSIKKEFPEWRIDKDNPDIWIQADLEVAWGGPRPYKKNMAHLLGGRISYVKSIFFVKIIRWETVIAEHRLKSSWRHSIPLFMKRTTNDEAFMENAGNVAEELVKIIKGPEYYYIPEYYSGEDEDIY